MGLSKSSRNSTVSEAQQGLEPNGTSELLTFDVIGTHRLGPDLLHLYFQEIRSWRVGAF